MNIPVPAWWAAVRLAERFQPLTEAERADRQKVLGLNRQLWWFHVEGARPPAGLPFLRAGTGAPKL